MTIHPEEEKLKLSLPFTLIITKINGHTIVGQDYIKAPEDTDLGNPQFPLVTIVHLKVPDG